MYNYFTKKVGFMAESIVVFISGSSGAGKNTIINKLVENKSDYKFLVSNTTRAKRDSDRKVGQYKFVSKEEFEDKINKGLMLEYDIFNGNYYGVDKESITSEKDNGIVLLKDLTVKGVLNCIDLLKDTLPMYSIFVTEKKSVLKKRLKLRGESRKGIKSRLSVYNDEHRMIPFYNFLVQNTDLEISHRHVESVINTCRNNLPILCGVSCQEISEKEIEKVVGKIEKGRKIKDVVVASKNDRIYIVKNINTYLAMQKLGLNTCLKFTNENVKIDDSEQNQTEWLKIAKSYKK